MAGNGNWQTRLQQWMVGRNGSDDAGRAVLGLAVFLMFVSFAANIFSYQMGSLFSWLAFLAIAYSVFRMLSRNTLKRQEENRAWVKRFSPVQVKFRRAYTRLKEWRTYHKEYRLYTCKSCGQSLRVPKGKGTVKVTCPKCKTSFTAKS